MHPHLFRSALARERNVVEYQVLEIPSGATVSLVCNGEINEERLRAELIDGLTQRGLKDPEIRIALVDQPEKTPLRSVKAVRSADPRPN